MHLSSLHDLEKAVSATSLFKMEQGNATALHISKGEQLKEHIAKTPALLICVIGMVVYENENGEHLTLNPGDYVSIQPMVRHWVDGLEDSHLILMK